jgi:protein-S-isoprenylcysteine O-methyltransferase Ste14
MSLLMEKRIKKIIQINYGYCHIWRFKKMRQGLGSEHPSCDKIQLLILTLFFIVWGIDTLAFFIFGYSTVFFQALAFPLLLSGTIMSLFLSLYLVSKSHKAVLEQVHDPPKLVVSSVYAWVRHPMYLGILFFCLAFLFISVSLVSIVIWIAFFIFYDRMATYEEKSLIEILGEQYIAYQKRVRKWIPGLY